MPLERQPEIPRTCSAFALRPRRGQLIARALAVLFAGAYLFGAPEASALPRPPASLGDVVKKVGKAGKAIGKKVGKTGRAVGKKVGKAGATAGKKVGKAGATAGKSASKAGKQTAKKAKQAAK